MERPESSHLDDSKKFGIIFRNSGTLPGTPSWELRWGGMTGKLSGAEGSAAARGLTVAEVVVALGLLALLMIVVLGIFTQLLASSTKNTLLQAGTLHADKVLNEAVRNARSSPPAFDPTATGQQGIYTHDETNLTIFYHTLVATPVTTFNPSAPGETWQLEVEVNWWAADASDPTRARPGYGKLYTRQQRMVYISR